MSMLSTELKTTSIHKYSIKKLSELLLAQTLTKSPSCTMITNSKPKTNPEKISEIFIFPSLKVSNITMSNNTMKIKYTSKLLMNNKNHKPKFTSKFV